MKSLSGKLKAFLAGKSSDEKGQALVEYALIIALMSITSLAMLSGLGKNVEKGFQKVNVAFTQAGGE